MIGKLKEVIRLYSFDPNRIPPDTIYIEITGACNLKCPNCPRTYSNHTRGHMPDDVFYDAIAKIKNDYPSLHHIGFHFFGEIILKPNFDILLHYARELLPKTNLAVSTNLAVNKHAVLNKLLNADLNSIGIWPDGFSEESYDKIRKGGSFKDVIDNIKYLLEERDTMGKNSSLSIHVGMVRNKVNDEFIDVFYDIFRFINDYKNTCMVISDSHDWAGQIPSEYVIKSVRNESLKILIPCRMPFNTLIISATGDASLCCYDMDLKLKIGNVIDSGIKDLWTSDEAYAIRNKIKHLNPPDLCRNCCNSYFYPAKLYTSFIQKKGNISYFKKNKHLTISESK